MDKKNRISNMIFIFMFVTMISLPLLFFNREEGRFSTIENKTLTTRPELYRADGSVNGTYISEFESYFNDNVGFKEEALAVNILVKHKLFGVLDIPNWMVGEDDNFFYTSQGKDVAVYAGKYTLPEATIQRMSENLSYLNTYFEEQGCTTYNMFIPNKEGVYSDAYDKDVYWGDGSYLDCLEQYMVEHTNLNVLNVKNALISQKEDDLYYKVYDASHWNMNGAFVGYQELMRQIQEDNPDIKMLSKEDFDIVEIPFSGLMKYYVDIPLLDDNFSFDDVIYEYELKGGYHGVLDETPVNGKEINPNLDFHHYKNETVDNSETLLILGDSYMYLFCLPMLAESFEDVYFVRNASAETIMELAQEIEPTIFVFEIAERVVNEPYFEYMNGYKYHLDTEVDIEEYELIAELPEIHIDIPQVNEGMITTDEGYVLEIFGWAFDNVNHVKPQMIVVEVDGEYRSAQFYERADLAQLGEQYRECAFQLQIEGKLLENANEITFYMITEQGQVYEGYTICLEK